jgi:ABC-type amino acid transport substrate-binding protein
MRRNTIVWFMLLVLVLTSACAQSTPAPAATSAPVETAAPSFSSGPTPEATGLAQYDAPSEGLVNEIKKRGVLRNGVECQNPPGEFFDKDASKCTGYSIELAQKLADSMGVKLEVIDTAWSGVIPSLYTKNFDIILSSMTITDARKKAVNFSKPVGCDQVTWITKKGDSSITKPEDLNGKVVATQLNSAAETQAKDLEAKLGIKYGDLRSFDHFDGAYLAVRPGKRMLLPVQPGITFRFSKLNLILFRLLSSCLFITMSVSRFENKIPTCLKSSMTFLAKWKHQGNWRICSLSIMAMV